MSFYLDASVLVPMRMREAASDAVDRFMAIATQSIFISDLAAGEVASALSRLVRMRLIDRDNAERRLSDFDEWREARADRFLIEPIDIQHANDLVRKFELGLRMPDAIHASACRRMGLTLVTLDRHLLDAARALAIAAVLPE